MSTEGSIPVRVLKIEPVPHHYGEAMYPQAEEAINQIARHVAFSGEGGMFTFRLNDGVEMTIEVTVDSADIQLWRESVLDREIEQDIEKDLAIGTALIFECPDCGEKFGRAASLGAHRARKHGFRSTKTKRA